jgi:mannose-1-phosphate guanylyltransferase
VSGFVEKPHAAAAAQLLAGGAIWNTMVMVARARDLVSLSATHVPDVTSMFLRALDSPAADQPALFREMYPLLPCADLSRDVLTPARGLMAYTWPSSIGWSDLGTPERLGVWLKAAPRYSNSVSDADRHAVAATL